MRGETAKDVEEYLAGCPAKARKLLEEIRQALLEELPGAEEAIRYGIPTLRLDGKNVIHFAAFAKHVSVYPAPRGVPEFEEDLAGYGGGKGTLQMPLDRPLPLDLVRRIARYRLREHREKVSPRSDLRSLTRRG